MGNNNEKEPVLKIRVISGEAQTQELFDFHSVQKEEISSNLTFPSVIALCEREVIYLPLDEVGKNCEPVYKIEKNSNREIFIKQLFQRTSENNENFIWKVLTQGEQLPLEEGDSIKIGRIKIKFKEIVSLQSVKSSTLISQDKDETERMEASHNFIGIVKNTEGQCRVCFQNSESLENPLLSLCKCSGSVKFIHYQCLKDWTSNNIKKDKSPKCLFYSYSQPECELCKQPIQNEFKYDGIRYKLHQFEKIQPPYAVFQNRFLDEETNKMRISVYLISLEENSEISIGRKHGSQVILRDISVSRNHCSLLYKFGKIFIQDRKSKYGTLVCPKKGFYFDSGQGLQLQFQSRIIKISEDKPFSGCCCAGNSSYFVQLNKSCDSCEVN